MTETLIDRKTNKSITWQEILEKFERDDIDYETEGSEISKFFAGKNIFLSGGTGFLGKLLVEKLLRACPDICDIYMLVRAKKGKDIHSRTDEIFNDIIFQKLSSRQPKFRHKIYLINGDIASPGLGITIEDRQTIIDKVDIFLHSAATVKFHEKLHIAVDINIKGTKEMLNLAKDCKKLECFVHISTAFSHCNRKDIDETLYDTPYDTDKIIQICNAVPPNMLETITPDIIGEWPNTYSFTKAIAENSLKKYASQFPICVIRPAIIITTYKEPLKCWTDNIYGAIGITLGAGIGLLRTAPIDENCTAEIVPADMVVNCIIAGAYKTAIEKPTDVTVYNYISSVENRITWKKYMYLTSFYGILTPSIKAVWIYSLILIANFYIYEIYKFMTHTIPAFLMDAGLVLIGKKPEMLTIYRKIHKFSDTLHYFGIRNWNFKNDNTQRLCEGLSDRDKKLFFFDMKQLDWEKMLMFICLGVRTYLIKDDASTIPQSRKKYLRTKFIHRALQIIGILILLRVIYALISYLFF